MLHDVGPSLSKTTDRSTPMRRPRHLLGIAQSRSKVDEKAGKLHDELQSMVTRRPSISCQLVPDSQRASKAPNFAPCWHAALFQIRPIQVCTAPCCLTAIRIALITVGLAGPALPFGRSPMLQPTNSSSESASVCPHRCKFHAPCTISPCRTSYARRYAPWPPSDIRDHRSSSIRRKDTWQEARGSDEAAPTVCNAPTAPSAAAG